MEEVRLICDLESREAGLGHVAGRATYDSMEGGVRAKQDARAEEAKAEDWGVPSV